MMKYISDLPLTICIHAEKGFNIQYSLSTRMAVDSLSCVRVVSKCKPIPTTTIGLWNTILMPFCFSRTRSDQV